MFASILIVILAALIGSLSIVTQYTKDPKRRRKIEYIGSIPAGLALYGSIAWLISHADRLEDLGVSPTVPGIALLFFLLIPAITYIFSPAGKDAARSTNRSR
jgi:hypothetical protein